MGKRDRRIEPTFGPPVLQRSSGLAVNEDDRVLPSGKKQPAKRKSTARAKKASGRPRRKRRGSLGLVGRFVYWCVVLGIWAGVAGIGLVAYYGAKMPAATTWTIPDRPPNVRIVSVDGGLIANRGMTGGEAVGLHEMSPSIPKAVIAIEDRRFYSHFGIDPIGLARAMTNNIMSGHFSQGGSTLTQQLAKNLFLKPDRTLERKVQEVLLALWLERNHTKDQILEMYLNRVYFGSGAYGVEAASRRYFGKSAREVTLSEAALLAGLLKAPSRLSPARDPKAAGQRAQLVLAAMRNEGMIDGQEMKLAMAAPARRAAAFWTGSENYVADRIVEELPTLIGETRSDVIVETTIDLHLQKLAEESIRKLIDANGKKLNVSQGALVSIDNTGAVRAMVGGVDYATSQFDRASEARRQPGSAFKPFVFLAAMEQGRTPQSVRNDAPIRIGNWTPENYQGKYLGRVTLATALARSLNSVSAQLIMETGPEAVVEAAHRLGIESKLQANTSLALGTSEVTPLELTAAYVPFANGGLRPEVHFVRRVTTASGEILYENAANRMPRILRPEIVGMMNAMMADTVDAGTGRKAAFGWPAAGKTGTSQKSRDAWFIGYTANLTTGVWFGNDDGSPMKNVTGGGLPVLAWHEFMQAAHHGVPVTQLPGGWNPDAVYDDALMPQIGVGDDTPAIGGDSPVSGAMEAADRLNRPAQPSGRDGGSVKRPEADVGGAAQKRPGTLLEAIFGRGG